MNAALSRRRGPVIDNDKITTLLTVRLE